MAFNCWAPFAGRAPRGSPGSASGPPQGHASMGFRHSQARHEILGTFPAFSSGSPSRRAHPSSRCMIEAACIVPRHGRGGGGLRRVNRRGRGKS